MKKILLPLILVLFITNCWGLEYTFETWHGNNLQLIRGWNNNQLDIIDISVVNRIIQLMDLDYNESSSKSSWEFSIFFQGWEYSYDDISIYENTFLKNGYIFMAGSVDSEHGDSVVIFYRGKNNHDLFDIFNYEYRDELLYKLNSIDTTLNFRIIAIDSSDILISITNIRNKDIFYLIYQAFPSTHIINQDYSDYEIYNEEWERYLYLNSYYLNISYIDLVN